MKKLFFALTTMLTLSISANAMSYEQARNEALFLTDKMAYELNLTDEQYEAAYEINLDYLMGVTGRDDVFGTYWERRNLDLSYILLDWQWNAFLAATYFYRPLYWEAGYWHFGIYRHYPRRDYFYFGRPHFYATYRGGHAWHVYGGRGYYHAHTNHFRVVHREHFGMHDRWNRGDFRGSRNSSTRITGHRGMDNRRIGNNRSAAIVTIATEEIMAIVAVGASAAIAAVATEARMATVAVEASTGHKVGAETSVVRAVATAPLVDPTEVVLSAEAAHVAEAHLAAEASTEVDLVAARSVEAHTAAARSVEDLTVVVMDMAADSEDTVNLTASAHAPQHSSYAVSHSWPCRNTQPELPC